MKIKFTSLIIILTIFTISRVTCDFYLPGQRYYNSNECYDVSYLKEFQMETDPLKNKDKMVVMTKNIKNINARINVAAYFTTSYKGDLADAHQFFDLIKHMDKNEKRYFPMRMDCFKEVKFFLYGFGSYDSYGLAYELHPTIEEYRKSSVMGNQNLDFLDLFKIFLDYFRGLKVLTKLNYYLTDMGEEDLGINLFQEEDGTITVQGRIRTLHKLRKGDTSKDCPFKDMSNYSKNLAQFVSYTGKNKPPLKGVSSCQNLNIAAVYDVFEDFASKAILSYHKSKDKNFSYCFDSDPENQSKCPEPFRPIWEDKDKRYIYRSIRRSVLKWTTETVIDQSISIFDALVDAEIARLAKAERVKVVQLAIQDKLKQTMVQIRQKELLGKLQMYMKKVRDEKKEIEISNGQDIRTPDIVSEVSKESSRKSEITNKAKITPGNDKTPINEKNSSASNSHITINPQDKEISQKSFSSVSQKIQTPIDTPKKISKLTSEKSMFFSENQTPINSQQNDTPDINKSENTSQDFLEDDSPKNGIVPDINEQVNEVERKINEGFNKKDLMMKALAASFLEKLRVQKDLDEDKMHSSGHVKKSDQKVIETNELAIKKELEKEKMLRLFQSRVKDQIEIINSKEKQNQELEKLDQVAEIMLMKGKIDALKNGSINTINQDDLDNQIAQINKKIDSAIKKYGSSMEVVDSKQITITLGGLKRELQPYYLKMSIENHGKLEIANDENEFIFL